ncbi:MAG: UpxY family transcription antiterminator [Chlorobium sp.]|uniref:UpxY family transcription antiterminator n=1 Tax=Chlorobium sp. TaxID=1095 RepID=UPI0025C3792E|nr:UpxY family transcription antiterminator [Chlorobium sp.]MCF8216385.1 UpxY family transcription antiterminator [Chlorobium sp.]MCF8271288.1 UpxY family transcription antiterminator [Chlorobium sp.]MCF8287662.1 UpxY family transcription antiterminator [Chlorobium sp.]MCF8291211.1 UpxY family transcription antiterminator [Chlorobium sp.]MCF8385296.1 UpxY family transcription antiterminator [Chlorobium sp.]
MTENERNAYWYAVYVRSRYEKKVNRVFIENSIESFLPLLETWRQWSDRKKKVSEPLFRGYVFVRIDMKSEHVKVLDTDGVVKFIGIGRTPSVISDRDIDWIRKLVREPDAVKGAVNMLPPGQKVKVTAGPFKDLEGVVVKTGRESRLVVYFDRIMQGIEVSIFPELLIPLHTAELKPAEN